jgi:hypothetical protein
MPRCESLVGAIGLRRTCLLFSALLLALSFSTELTAQTTTSGGLTGVVTDPSHAVVLGAEIKIDNQSKGTTQSTKTDREGVHQRARWICSSFMQCGSQADKVISTDA